MSNVMPMFSYPACGVAVAAVAAIKAPAIPAEVLPLAEA
tara:strand:- start:609 stop:725 length:117 start_codon:yes stop_codon:yes gene_type:complete